MTSLRHVGPQPHARSFQRKAVIGAPVSAVLALALAASGAGCAGDEQLSPLPVDAGTTPPDAPTNPPDAGPPPKRTVILRNPFGNVAETQNLLWDGDFEWASPFADEYGWWQDNGAVLTDVVVGPSCRSGVKCARVKPSSIILGIAVSSKDFALDVSVYAKFEDKGAATPCSKVIAALTSVGVHDEPKNTLVADPAPDADGWCRLSVMAPKHVDKVFLQIRNAANVPVLIDDAVVKPTSAIMVDSATFQAATVPTAEDEAEADALRTLVASHAGPHDAPPNQATRAYRAWKGLGEGGVAP